MTDILKTVEADLPPKAVESANFEGANIVVYTSDKNFFLEGNQKIKDIVNKIKKRIELRAEQKLLKD